MSTAARPAPDDNDPRKLELEEATINIRIEGAKEAIKRSRLAFLISIVASLAILTTVWNAYVSWDRRFPLLENFPQDPQTQEPQEITKQVIEQFIRQHVDSTTITVSLLGIRVGVSDLSVLGSLSLLVLSIWLFFSIRRENHAIGMLLRDTREKCLAIRHLVYSGVSSFLIFSTSSISDAPISTLEITEKTRTSYVARWAITFLFYLPSLALVFVIFMDFYSIYGLSSIASYPHEALKRFIPDEIKTKFWIMESCAFVLGGMTSLFCARIDGFARATEKVMREYKNRLKESEAGHPA